MIRLDGGGILQRYHAPSPGRTYASGSSAPAMQACAQSQHRIHDMTSNNNTMPKIIRRYLTVISVGEVPHNADCVNIATPKTGAGALAATFAIACLPASAEPPYLQRHSTVVAEHLAR